MRWRFIVAVLAIELATTAAHAQEMPRYDPAGWCERVAGIAGGQSEVLRKACLEEEQGQYNKLKVFWSQVPAKTRNWCNQVAKGGGARGSYVLLEQCVDEEFSSKKKNDNTNFKF